MSKQTYEEHTINRGSIDPAALLQIPTLRYEQRVIQGLKANLLEQRRTNHSLSPTALRTAAVSFVAPRSTTPIRIPTAHAEIRQRASLQVSAIAVPRSDLIGARSYDYCCRRGGGGGVCPSR